MQAPSLCCCAIKPAFSSQNNKITGTKSLFPSRIRPARALIIKSAQKNEIEPPTNKTKTNVEDVEKLLADLNINKSTAKQVLQVWRSAGVNDPEDLSRLVKKRGADKSIAIFFQLGIDASSAFIAWYSGYNLAVSRSLGSFTLAAEFVVYTLAMYLTINAALDVYTLYAVGISTRKYSTGTAASLLEAVQSMAGPETGLDVVDKAKKAIVTAQVLKALDQILDRLKLSAGDIEMNDGNFLRDLGAYVVLLKATESGFTPESAGVTMQEAADVAAEFSMVDSNGDGTIDAAEFRKLCGALAPNLSAEEAEAAMSVLDKNSDGAIDFKEFLAWWKPMVNNN
jgi:calmodulin